MTAEAQPPPDADLAAAIACHDAGELQRSERLCRAVLGRDPACAEACNLLGVIAAQQGQPGPAVDWLGRAIAIEAENPEFHYNLGLVRQALGEREAAIACYRQAVGLRQDYAEAWSNLGNLLLHKGAAADAEACLRTACRLAPASALAHNSLGAVLMVRQAPEAAAASFAEAVRLQPDYAEALNGLGLALGAQGRFDPAAEAFEGALEVRPGYGEASNNLGYLRLLQDRMDEAERLLRQALAQKPGYLPARLNLATLLVERPDLAAGLAAYEAILATHPGQPEALAGKANTLEKLERFEEAEAILRPALARGAIPHRLVPLYGRLALRDGAQDQAIARLERQLAAPGLTAGNRRFLHFTLANLHDQSGAFDAAFGHYAAGNALRPVDYDPETSARAVARRIAYFDAQGLAGLPRAAAPSEMPVFIVGMPRSGTSLVEQILSCHPAVFAAGEREDLGCLATSLGFRFADDDPAPPAPAESDAAALQAAGAGYLEALGSLGGGAPRVCDKMPYNFQHLGLISRLLPGARVIHCTRHPLDTCLSCYFQDFTRGNFQTFDLAHLGAYYRLYRQIMDHWAAVLDLPLLEVRYEAHVADPEGTCRRMLDFLGLDWDPRCLRFHESRRFVKTASVDQVRQPIYTRSVQRWRRYEAHIGPLKAALGDLADVD